MSFDLHADITSSTKDYQVHAVTAKISARRSDIFKLQEIHTSEDQTTNYTIDQSTILPPLVVLSRDPIEIFKSAYVRGYAKISARRAQQDSGDNHTQSHQKIYQYISK